MIRKITVLLAFTFCIYNYANAQTNHEQSGWFFFLNSTKFNEKWGLHFDLQVRSHDDWDGIRSILVRPGLTYFIKPNQNATVGYLFTSTFTRTDGTPNTTLIEHRVWEQYIISHKAFTGNLSHRFRLEQRFIEKPSGDAVFAQRLRYFFRHVQPLTHTESGFTKGPFAALQNEVFANIHNKENTNNHFFDQNRAYIALGYRFSKKLI
ncbi:DUF2490 domain-containing protein [Niabella ginsengisoli]|uniref:DUF2490 domain-containing protein n=1 Tax=Niabella ginsengisoli TaxID=522298 RepID=A0ABS9SJS1_9BACT|nr:DUF2490 domain-containing protein [Niabella ginsengisoli]MCH5598605.1 DUF2490 domain-containing protein [Niabella ginsengisoli]